MKFIPKYEVLMPNRRKVLLDNPKQTKSYYQETPILKPLKSTQMKGMTISNLRSYSYDSHMNSKFF